MRYISFLPKAVSQIFHFFPRLFHNDFIPTHPLVLLYFFSISFLPRDLFHWLPRFISFQFHFYLGIYFIGSPALFLFNFISTQGFVSLPPQLHFFSNFIPIRDLFHWLPGFISFQFHSYPSTCFIGSLALFLFKFHSYQGFISLVPQLYFFSISFLLIHLFHCLFNFIPTQRFISLAPYLYFFPLSFLSRHLFHWLPRFISFQFHFYPGVCFIGSLALFLSNFIPTQGFISFPDQIYFIGSLAFNTFYSPMYSAGICRNLEIPMESAGIDQNSRINRNPPLIHYQRHNLNCTYFL